MHQAPILLHDSRCEALGHTLGVEILFFNLFTSCLAIMLVTNAFRAIEVSTIYFQIKTSLLIRTRLSNKFALQITYHSVFTLELMQPSIHSCSSGYLQSFNVSCRLWNSIIFVNTARISRRQPCFQGDTNVLWFFGVICLIYRHDKLARQIYFSGKILLVQYQGYYQLRRLLMRIHFLMLD